VRHLLSVVALTLSQGAHATSPPVGADALQARRAPAIAATLRYRNAWRANDPAQVMATLTRDAVLLPSGLEPIVGEKAIRRFWWPGDGPSTTVIAMEQFVDDVSVDGGVAIVRGHGSVHFILTQAGKKESRAVRHSFLNVVRRQADGSWLIAQRMWSDLH
jgi:uncharacterized protein (TIGR02246 family)